jgi:hypothetical protein
MKMFSKVLVGVVASAALFAVAPGATAATTKALSVKVHASTQAVKVTVNGSASCRSLPSHGEPQYVTVSGVTLKGGDRVSVGAFNSGDCSGSATKSISNVTVSSYPLPNTLHLDLS